MAKKRKSSNTKSSPRQSTRTSRWSSSKNFQMELNSNHTIIETNNQTRERREEATPPLPREQCKQTTSLSSRLSRVMGKVKEDVKSTWDVHFTASPTITTLRDFAFPIQEGVIVFFSTHPLLCKDVFGFDHGETFIIERGLWSGLQATVIGVRNNMLWIVLAGDTFAQVLPTPPQPESSFLSEYAPLEEEEREEELQSRADKKGDNMRECFCEEYKIRFVNDSQSSNDASRNNCVKKDQNSNYTQSVAGKLISLLWKQRQTPECVKNYSNDLSLTKRERDFLQNAPDLFVQLVSEKESNDENDIVRTGVRMSSHEQVMQKYLQVHEVEDLYKRSLRKHRSASLMHSKMPESTGDVAQVMSASTIVLSPCMLPGSKALGWSGEGSVVVPQTKHISSNNVNGDMLCVNASLSASIVML